MKYWLDIDHIAWSDMRHAYGSAGDIPALLKVVYQGAPEDREVWRELWGSLCHQGDVYGASIAAAPFIVDAGIKVLSEGGRFSWDYIDMPAEIERCRAKFPQLATTPAYIEARVRMNDLIQLCEAKEMDETLQQVVKDARDLLSVLGLLRVEQRGGSEGELC